MGTKGILNEIDAETGRLQQVRSILAGTKDGRQGKRMVKSAPKKRQLSAEARARIAAAQRARWGKAKKAAK